MWTMRIWLLRRISHFIDVRASHASVFWKSTCCIYSKRRGSRSEARSARTVEVFAKKTAAPGTADGTDRRCVYGQSAPAGRMVMIEAEHLCMTMRGIKNRVHQTVTTVTRGVFDNNKELQDTFYQMVRL